MTEPIDVMEQEEEEQDKPAPTDEETSAANFTWDDDPFQD